MTWLNSQTDELVFTRARSIVNSLFNHSVLSGEVTVSQLKTLIMQFMRFAAKPFGERQAASAQALR